MTSTRKGEFWYNNSQVMKGLTDCSGGNVKVLEDTVAGIKPSGATRADYGLELAGDITSGRADAKKIVVFFTDGKPTSYSEFDSGVADAAVTAAKNMKDSKATVYTIGIFSGADPAADPSKKGTSDVNELCTPCRVIIPMPRRMERRAWHTRGKLRLLQVGDQC